jgi:hypothetical protein
MSDQADSSNSVLRGNPRNQTNNVLKNIIVAGIQMDLPLGREPGIS